MMNKTASDPGWFRPHQIFDFISEWDMQLIWVQSPKTFWSFVSVKSSWPLLMWQDSRSSGISNDKDCVFAINQKVYLFQSGFIKILSADVGEKIAKVQLPNVFHDDVRFVFNRPHPCGSNQNKVKDKVTWIPYVVVRLSTGRHAVYAFNVETYDVLKVHETNQMTN